MAGGKRGPRGGACVQDNTVSRCSREVAPRQRGPGSVVHRKTACKVLCEVCGEKPYVAPPKSIDHRRNITIPRQGTDHTGERTEGIRTDFVPGAVRCRPRYHNHTQRPPRPVVRRLWRRNIQESQQVPSGVLPASLGLQPAVVTIRRRMVPQMMAHPSRRHRSDSESAPSP